MSKKHCPECREALPDGAPEGMCPHCLLSLGFLAEAFAVSRRPDEQTISVALPVETSGPLPDRGAQRGSRIGRYTLSEPIGEGGFGTVWMAEQTDPVRRKVALKIIKPGMDTREVVARFEAERQALAMMDHPNIARVFDGGSTDAGRPYFVMELVRGVRITEYCDTHRLNTGQRLELFMEVCQAVQHAHQKGIIHRDLKPSNVLVTEQDGRAVPKVIDFGIAKATEVRLTDQTFFTRFNQVVGTPAYMSPEQAGLGGLDIDTRSDVYALGVILYELLTGRTPFSNEELLKAGLDEVLRTIREKEPPKPSTRISTLSEEERSTAASQRSALPAKLSQLLSGELDWIVMKCLEKDRTRRYETASGLAQDLARYVNDEPISAAAPSFTYQLAKFVRRHRAALVTAAAFVAVLVAGTIVSVWQAVRATRYAAAEMERRTEAQTAKADAEQQRGIAERNFADARLHLYAADMNLVGQALAVNNLDRARSLLRKHTPQAGEPEFRGWEWHYFANESIDRSFAQWDHPREAITRLAFLPDQRTLLSFSSGGQASAWEWPSGALQSRTGARLSLVAISTDGRHVASARSSGLEFFDWPGTNPVQVLPKRSLIPEGGTSLISINHLQFSPDAQLLACSGPTMDRTRFRVYASVWDWREARPVLRLTLTNQLHANNGVLAFSPDGRRLAVGGSPGLIHIITLPEGGEAHTLQLHDEQIVALAFSPDGRWLAAGSGMRDNLVRVFDTRDGFAQRALRGHASYVKTLAFSPDNRWLVSGGNDQAVRVWDTRQFTLANTLRGHAGEITALAVAPDSRQVVSGSIDGDLKVWPIDPLVASNNLVQLPFVNLARFSADLKYTAGMTDEGEVVFGVVEPETKLNPVPALGRRHLPFNSRLDLSPNGRLLVLADGRGGLRLWDRESGNVITNGEPRGRAAWHLMFIRDGQEIVASYSDDWVKVWSLDLQERGAWQVRKDIRRAARNVVSELGVYAGRGPGTLEFFDLHDGHRLGGGTSRGGDLTGLAVSPDRRILAISDDEGTVEFWDTQTWQFQRRIRGHLQSVRSVTYSPDGRRLAIGGIGLESVKLWDVDLLQELCTLPVESTVCHTLKFSRDGTSLAVAMGPAGFQILRGPRSP